MTVLPFPSPRAAWSADELEHLVATADALRRVGLAQSWAIGETEYGDPQFFVLAPAPDHDCLLAFARLGGTFVLEDGMGKIVGESKNLARLAARAEDHVGHSRIGLATRAILAVAALRLLIEEKVEPVLAEGGEIVARIAPQLAMLG